MNEINTDKNQSPAPDIHTWNFSAGNATHVPKEEIRWAILGLLLIIVFSALGNLLVCLAVCWERRLQNMTNYFLMSLAIADFLVSLLVMPLGMVVELYGFFPLDPELCVMWVTSDVLMCTASIWHMCTMSMDRYFTLKYPMRYGRNKTKTMVALKIFFVWVVSFAISSPICIHGFVDTSIVFRNGFCVPTLKHFVIYGSIFAFYIPLLIMIATYVLTIRILWKNQRLMKKIERSDMRPRLAHLNDIPTLTIPQLLTPPSESSNINRVTFPETTEMDCSYLMPPLQQNRALTSEFQSRPSSPAGSETEEDELDNLSSSHLLDQRSQSCRSLCRKPRNDQGFVTRSKESICNPSFQTDEMDRIVTKHRNKKSKKHYLTVPTEGYYRRGHGHSSNLYSTASDTQLPDACRSEPHAKRTSLHLSFNQLDNDYKSVEWDRRFFQIQQEMDQCLMDAEKEQPKQESASGQKPDLILCEEFVRYTLRPMCQSAPNTPLRTGFMSDSADSLNEADTKSSSSSNNSDIITIQLHSPKSPSSPNQSEGSTVNGVLPNNSNMEMKEWNDQFPVEDTDRFDSPDISNMEQDSDENQVMSLQHRRRFKTRLRATLRASLKRPVMKHLLSKKTATNERKASKVLGIIFLVFVFLWTPFFIMNILSVTCENCMANVTGTMMSVFLWMGYSASLANPVIYTMFNTAFRRTFIKILTCKLRYKTSKYADTALMSYTTMMHSERRNTMTVLIKDDSR